MTERARDTLAERLEAVQDGISNAARDAGRSTEDISTIVVTKFHPASLVRELVALGVRDFGESRHQEARSKVAELSDLDVTWHFVGQVQSKKARQVAQYSQVIHSVDRAPLVNALASQDGSVDCFLQINLTGNPSRGGVAPDELEQLASRALVTPGINVLGVMAIAPLEENPRSAFARVRESSDQLQTLIPDARWISAGMSSDYREAIMEGATHLRIGTAITGNRPQAG